jgi:hypothetical protein
MSEYVELMTARELFDRFNNGESSLELSIEHWDRITLALKNKQKVSARFYGSETCGLCHEYLPCNENPVCSYVEHYGYACDSGNNSSTGHWVKFNTCPTYENAIAMRDALVELRETNDVTHDY